MTIGIPVEFSKRALYIGDGGDPEDFVRPCGITSVSTRLSVQTRRVTTPNYDFPNSRPMKTEIREVGRAYALQFSGLLLEQDLATWTSWYRNGGSRNVRWSEMMGHHVTGASFELPGLLTDFETTGEFKNYWRISGGIELSGLPVWQTYDELYGDLIALYGDDLSAILQALENAING
ncbi:hypothetical protein [Ponticaulis profundi]|uniref:Phage tail protein n=1 Tax=Ponticaulis profundi TaxID=2665222 RepID=A0ABW1S855_9PROT